jgi:succinate dehydrogenase / fumarate reductase flavoprotein subunit/fumarate reductase (CoM/CoB) subunit A
MVGLDPTTWEPTRVKLGGRLLNGKDEEFLQNYTGTEGGSAYDTARDVLTFAIYKEVEEGRGSPHGGVYLSFQHIAPEALERALGPVLEIFARNNIDLSRAPVEVFPIAHYQMGGIEVDLSMATRVPGLYAAGEVVGGANGANRLSGNALPEALVFGERAGLSAAAYARRRTGREWDAAVARPCLDTIRGIAGRNSARGVWPGHLLRELKELMWNKVGAFRTAVDLSAACRRINAMRLDDLERLTVDAPAAHNTSLVEWCELRSGLLAAEAVALAALNRRESRGAHQRVDFPHADDQFRKGQHVALKGRELVSDFQDALP